MALSADELRKRKLEIMKVFKRPKKPTPAPPLTNEQKRLKRAR